MSITDMFLKLIMVQKNFQSASKSKRWLERICNVSLSLKAQEDAISIKIDEIEAKRPHVPEGGFANDEEAKRYIGFAKEIIDLMRQHTKIRARRKHWYLAKFWHTLKTM